MSRTIIRGSLLAAAVALVLFRSYWAMAEDASPTMTIYVSQSGDDDNFDGLTPDTAKKTVAGAIAAVGSASPAEILILPSTTAYTLGTPARFRRKDRHRLLRKPVRRAHPHRAVM